jgi:hypothetical protein
MKEYIERAAAIERFTVAEKEADCPGVDFTVIKRMLSDIPAADVVEVTFCKDCRYYQDAKVNEKGFLICPASGMEITEADYCSYGERMDKEDEHEQ